jgi:hypothetical protein
LPLGLSRSFHGLRPRVLDTPDIGVLLVEQSLRVAL